MSNQVGPKRGLFEVEREKKWRMWLMFALLLALAFVSVWLVSLVVGLPAVSVLGWASLLHFSVSPTGVGIILLGSAVLAALYWFVAQIGAYARLMSCMHARALDPSDRFHQRFADLVEEMRIASGAPHLECVVVPTPGLNAFAFSDLKGKGCVGVTEGALARLSRQQLEAVVAHEVAHVASGDYVTVTVACLLFGVYSGFGESLIDAAEGTSVRSLPLVFASWGLAGLLAALDVAAMVINAALSRDRESEADLVAARFTRDPVSLAQALRMIERHPGGAGYTVPGLAPLCIRAADPDRRSWLTRAVATHPPTEERIATLLSLAHMGRDEFERQAAEADAAFAGREQTTRPPGPSVTAPGLAAVAAPVAAAAVPIAAAIAPVTGVDAPVAGPAAPVAAPVAEHSAPVAPGVAHGFCPVCGRGLETADYEGVSLLVCNGCGGRLVSSEQVARVCARREMAFSEQQKALAAQVLADGDQLRRDAVVHRYQPGGRLITCPKCRQTMMRRQYSYEYAIEIDYCGVCGLFWFDRDELEALQVLAERTTQ
jgi:heat shock protein HtpX